MLLTHARCRIDTREVNEDAQRCALGFKISLSAESITVATVFEVLVVVLRKRSSDGGRHVQANALIRNNDGLGESVCISSGGEHMWCKNPTWRSGIDNPVVVDVCFEVFININLNCTLLHLSSFCSFGSASLKVLPTFERNLATLLPMQPTKRYIPAKHCTSSRQSHPEYWMIADDVASGIHR